MENIKILGLEQKTDADNNKDNKISIEDDEKKRNWIGEWENNGKIGLPTR